MAHIDALGSGIFTYMDYYKGDATPASEDVAGYKALFSTVTTDVDANELFRIESVREFPSIGTPANIVNVPVYGQKTSSQVQGQADAPTLELTINYIPTNVDGTDELHDILGTQVYFRFMMCDAATTLTNSIGATIANKNTSFYFKGKVEAILVNPSLTDQTTATVTLSTQSDFFGPDTK